MEALFQKRPGEDEAPVADVVFERLLEDIVGGTYSSGARLPAERELARRLDTSRATLRDALRRLSEWNVVESRRGSGVVVRDRRDWSIEVLPAVLRYAPEGVARVRMLRDLLELRRKLIVGVVELCAAHIPEEGLSEARAAIERAWKVRHDSAAFVTEDFEMMRSILEATEMYPALWLLNRMAGIYLDIAGAMSGQALIPDDYLETHRQFFDALEAGNSEAAREIIADYLTRHDEALFEVLEVGQ